MPVAAFGTEKGNNIGLAFLNPLSIAACLESISPVLVGSAPKNLDIAPGLVVYPVYVKKVSPGFIPAALADLIVL